MIEVRELTKNEVVQLIKEAHPFETERIGNITQKLGISPYDFLKKYSYELKGLVINNRPVYIGSLVRDKSGYLLWTVVNRDVRHQKTLYKEAKRIIYEWLSKYGEITATMSKRLDNNIKWTKKMGFKVIDDNDTDITLSLSKHKEVN